MKERRVRFQVFQDIVRGAVARRGAALMGICNVTPDSFSDGGRYLDRDAAKAHVDRLVAEGADIIDIGGESTRPGCAPIPPAVQIDRVIDVVRHAAARHPDVCVSIDTTSAEVAAACLDAGAHAVNDVSLLSEEELAKVAGGSHAAPRRQRRAPAQQPVRDQPARHGASARSAAGRFAA